MKVLQWVCGQPFPTGGARYFAIVRLHRLLELLSSRERTICGLSKEFHPARRASTADGLSDEGPPETSKALLLLVLYWLSYLRLVEFRTGEMIDGMFPYAPVLYKLTARGERFLSELTHANSPNWSSL